MKKQLSRRIQFLFSLVIVFNFCLLAEKNAHAEDSLNLTLPKEIYAVPGVDTGIYFENIVRTETISDYRFEVKCKLGESNEKTWSLSPTLKDVGQHELTITIKDAQGTVQATQTTSLVIVPKNAGQDRKIRLLIIGDSLTHAT